MYWLFVHLVGGFFFDGDDGMRSIIGLRCQWLDGKCKSLTVLPFWLNETNVPEGHVKGQVRDLELAFSITGK